ncbi:phage tail protein [Saccharothrix algeriensis]|uniref:Phage tail protein n=1 Tax=Saccharothrix algeriensis TaxID=173560 RepID=A0A8T8HXN4_9PSEU|nr:phage tail protein [Saccharothrix algeriensis]MBM7815032.1 phage tail-like protein [Saccharothrix algeriensis]QTR03282.1 phage tail protein [Saccharothrix algeriensis]
MTDTVFASSVFFQLSIAGNDLGAFHTCDGLSAEVEVERFDEGGNNGFAWQLPSRITWSNITMTRPVTADSAKVLKWFNEIIQRAERKDGEIVALTPELDPIVRWQVLGVIPIRWQGPSFDPSRSQVAVETLEFAHEGIQAS